MTMAQGICKGVNCYTPAQIITDASDYPITRLLSHPLRRSRRSSQDAGHARPRRLLRQVIIVQQRGALAGERIRNPAVLVRDAPDGHADAAVHVEARAHHVREVVALRHQRAVGGREGRVADVQLGVGDLEAEGREAAQRRGEGGPRGGGPDNEVALEANAVDGGAGVLDDLGGLEDAVCLGAVVLEVIVIQISEGEESAQTGWQSRDH